MRDNLTIQSPAGEVRFSAEASCIGKCDIRLTEHTLSPILWRENRVDYRRAVLLRVYAEGLVTHLRFTARIVITEVHLSPESGEHLEAFSWEDKLNEAMLGTEDCEQISRRLSIPEFTFNNYPVTHERNEVAISLANLPSKHIYSFHYILATKEKSKRRDANDVDCWLAVDEPHEKISRL